MTRAKLSEAQLAAIVVGHLERNGLDVYQEVEMRGGVYDIVAKTPKPPGEIWIVEVKVALSLRLITQALTRMGYASRVIVAAPDTRHARAVGDLCRLVGLGLWVVHPGQPDYPVDGKCWDPPRVRQIVEAELRVGRDSDLRARLRPEHKTHAKAGAIGAGGRWTPFRATCEELARIVAEQPGITLKAAVDAAAHHYRSNRSAVSSLAHWIGKGKVPGVRGEGIGGAIVLQPAPSGGT